LPAGAPHDEGPMVALRADIDALEMDDEKDVHYRSQTPGVAHACGHDVHTSVVLGAGLYLAQLASQEGRLDGRVRLIFQPAEERVPGGALDVIDDKGLDGVDAVLGVHCAPKLDVGKIGLRAGSITAAADMIEITLSGPGGHTARPEDTVDMISLAARIVTELPAIVNCELGDLGDEGSGTEVKLVFGSVHSGDASNVIPTHAVVRGTARTRSVGTWQSLPAAFDRAVAALLDGTGATVETAYVHGVPPVDNDETITELVRRSAAPHLAADAITEAEHSWGGDDFAWYLRNAPGTYIRLGTHDPEGDHEPHDLHVGQFDVDERSIAVGVRVLAASVLELFDSR